MAKKSSTIHIENCFWDLIDAYQKENNMSSRNTAIECILSEYKALKRVGTNGVSITSTTNIPKAEHKESEKNNPMYGKLRDMENDMPD